MQHGKEPALGAALYRDMPPKMCRSWMASISLWLGPVNGTYRSGSGDDR
jgi:hypothetical protein